MKKNTFCLVMFFFTILSYSQIKQDKIKELISLSGAFPISKEVEKELISRYKKKYDHVPDSAWKSIEGKVNIDEVLNKIINIYESRFNEKEIEELIIFYKSDIGKKIIQNSSGIKDEIQDSISNWGMKITQTINNDLEKMGYLKSPPPTQSNPPPPMSIKTK